MSDATQSPLAPSVSPLLEADPNSINEFIQQRVDDVFNTRPLLLDDAALRVAVEYYRAQRERFLKESQEKANKPPAARRKAPASVAEALASTTDLL